MGLIRGSTTKLFYFFKVIVEENVKEVSILVTQLLDSTKCITCDTLHSEYAQTQAHSALCRWSAKFSHIYARFVNKENVRKFNRTNSALLGSFKTKMAAVLVNYIKLFYTVFCNTDCT